MVSQFKIGIIDSLLFLRRTVQNANDFVTISVTSNCIQHLRAHINSTKVHLN